MTGTRFSHFSCHSCGSSVEVFTDQPLESLVASDCRPVKGSVDIGGCTKCGLLQKNASAEWKSLCDEIYRGYKIYHQAGGSEQKARGGGSESKFAPRSELIADFIGAGSTLPERGALLDIGCGNGALLRAWNKKYPGWTVVGTDYNETFKRDVEAIGPSARFLSNDEFQQHSGEYNLLTLIHCIEHIPSPAAFLADARRFLREDGVLLVEVPDAELNPFDLTIADHASHFFKSTLYDVVEAAGYDVIACGNAVLSKEITLLARPKHSRNLSPVGPKPSRASKLGRSHVRWLRDVMALGRTLSERSVKFGIFGTSIAGSWLGSSLPRVDFYVDEDDTRVGRKHLGRPVLGPSDIPPDATVYVCLEYQLASAIASRLAGPGRRFVIPPRLGESGDAAGVSASAS